MTLNINRTPVTLKNPLSPNLMSPEERVQAVASLFATGFLRFWLRAQERKKPLDLLGSSSDPCANPRCQGEKAHE